MEHDFWQTDATLCQQRGRQLSEIHHFVIDRSRSCLVERYFAVNRHRRLSLTDTMRQHDVGHGVLEQKHRQE